MSYLAQYETAADATRVLVFLFSGIVVGGALLLFLALRWRHLKRARAAADSEKDPRRPLTPGDAVISGRVVAEGNEPVVTISIAQIGREWKHKGRWYHNWRETGRSVTAQPFYLVRPSGERLRVEPSSNVFLIDKLDGIKEVGPLERERLATLRHDEPVHVVGTLVRGHDPRQGGYRDAGTALVLRPPRAGRMLISTEPLEARFARRARFYRQLVAVTLVSLAFLHGVVLTRFTALSLFGHEVRAQVTSSRSWRVWHKPRRSSGYYVYHYEITAADPSGRVLRDETSSDFYKAVQAGVQEVPFLVAGPFAQIGQEATATDSRLTFLILLSLSFAVAMLIVVRSSRPWYDRRRIDDGGGDRLNAKTVSVR